MPSPWMASSSASCSVSSNSCSTRGLSLPSSMTRCRGRGTAEDVGGYPIQSCSTCRFNLRCTAGGMQAGASLSTTELSLPPALPLHRQLGAGTGRQTAMMRCGTTLPRRPRPTWKRQQQSSSGSSSPCGPIKLLWPWMLQASASKLMSASEGAPFGSPPARGEAAAGLGVPGWPPGGIHRVQRACNRSAGTAVMRPVGGGSGGGKCRWWRWPQSGSSLPRVRRQPRDPRVLPELTPSTSSPRRAPFQSLRNGWRPGKALWRLLHLIVLSTEEEEEVTA